MKLKIQFLFVLSLSLVSIKCSAQKFSLGINSNYSFSAMGNVIGTKDSIGIQGSSGFYTIESKNVKGSFGEGISLGIDLGYKISDNIHVNLGAQFLRSRKFIITPDLDIPDVLSAELFRLNPGVTCNFNDEKKVVPYIHSELSFAFKSKMTDKTEYGNKEYVTERSGGYGLGFEVGIGSFLKVSKKISLSLELNGIHQTYCYSKAEITKATRSGADILSTFSFSESHSVYKDVVKFSDNLDSNSPTVILKEFVPFSSAGIRIGLNFFFFSQSKPSN